MIEQKNPSVYDYDACRALWQRVSPSEDPYPAAEEVGTQSGELSLPGAEGDPCCWERRRRIPSRCCKAFCARNWGDAQVYAYLAANLPRARDSAPFPRAQRGGKAPCARPCRRDLPDHRKALLPRAYALKDRIWAISARCCAPFTTVRPARATTTPAPGEETLDLCLGKLFAAMSADEYRHAETLLKLLGRKMNI